MNEQNKKYEQNRKRLGLSFAVQDPIQMKAYNLIAKSSKAYGGATAYISQAVIAFGASPEQKQIVTGVAGSEDQKNFILGAEIKEILTAIMEKIDKAPLTQPITAKSPCGSLTTQEKTVEIPAPTYAEEVKKNLEPLIAVYNAPQGSDRPIPSEEAQREMIENLALFG